jgi:hypothetical protein
MHSWKVRRRIVNDDAREGTAVNPHMKNLRVTKG